MKVPFSPHPCQHLLLVVFLIAILMGEMESYCGFDLHFLYGQIWYFFMFFFGHLTSSFEKVLFSSVAHFLIGSLILGEFSFLRFLYILVISPLSDV
jgi:hypothetical protein